MSCRVWIHRTCLRGDKRSRVAAIYNNPIRFKFTSASTERLNGTPITFDIPGGNVGEAFLILSLHHPQTQLSPQAVDRIDLCCAAPRLSEPHQTKFECTKRCEDKKTACGSKNYLLPCTLYSTRSKCKHHTGSSKKIARTCWSQPFCCRWFTSAPYTCRNFPTNAAESLADPPACCLFNIAGKSSQVRSHTCASTLLILLQWAQQHRLEHR